MVVHPFTTFHLVNTLNKQLSVPRWDERLLAFQLKGQGSDDPEPKDLKKNSSSKKV